MSYKSRRLASIADVYVAGAMLAATGAIVSGSLGHDIGDARDKRPHDKANERIVEIRAATQQADTVRLNNGRLLQLEIGARCVAIIRSVNTSDSSQRLSTVEEVDTGNDCGSNPTETSGKIVRFDEITAESSTADTQINALGAELAEAEHDARHSTTPETTRNYAIAGGLVIGGLGIGFIKMMGSIQDNIG